MEGTLKYQVEQVDETVVVNKVRRGEDGQFEFFEDTEPYGYDVFFPQGHSIRVRTSAELKRLDLHRQPGLVDMETGEEFPDDDREDNSPKARVAKATRRRSTRNRSVEAATA